MAVRSFITSKDLSSELFGFLTLSGDINEC